MTDEGQSTGSAPHPRRRRGAQSRGEGTSVAEEAGAPTGGELETRLRQQALLAELGRRALADSDFDVLLGEVARLSALGMGTRLCKVLEYRRKENTLIVRAGVGWHEGVVGHATVGADLDSPAGYALHTGKPVISNHLESEDRFRTPKLLAAHGVRRAVNVILLGEGRPWGVLEVDSEEPGAFSEHDVDFLQAAAGLLGLALERRRSDAALRDLAAELEARVEAEVAERRQAEDALRQMQKMEAVGQLTGGVAHDFNNLLQVISGNLALLAQGVAGDARLERLAANARKGADRGAQLTSQLLAFARRQALRPQVRPVNDLVREFDALAARMLGEAVAVEFALDPEAGACHADPAQFGSALLNLVVNARDAMPDGGRLVVRTGNAALDARAAARHPDAHPGRYVVVEIEDSGAGMSPEVIERATEPFFTTKELGKGTGLGLSQVYGFARQSGGFLAIASGLGTGTRVSIHLPWAEAEMDAAEDGSDAALPDGAGTILVVEDDDDVRELVMTQLEALGYAVVESANGPAALALLESANAPAVDLLLTDVVMPGGMNGVELVREARIRQPRLRALLTSGYVTGGVAEAAAGLPMLPKPYAPADLARAVRDVLSAD